MRYLFPRDVATYSAHSIPVGVAIALSLCYLCASPSFAVGPVIEEDVYYYTDTATINNDISGNDVIIGRNPGGTIANALGDSAVVTPYTVTIAAGANVTYNPDELDGYFGLQLYNNTALNMTGGSVYLVRGTSTTVLNISGGTVAYAFLQSGTLNISGSASVSKVDCFLNDTVNISGGSVNSIHDSGNSSLSITGGSVANVIGFFGTTLDISGGSVQFASGYGSSAFNVSSGNVTSITAYDSSTLSLTGGSIYAAVSRNDSTLDISTDASVNFIVGFNNSILNLGGGSMTNILGHGSSFLNLTGGAIGSGGISLLEDSVLRISGVGLSFVFASMGSDAYGSFTAYTLFGTLQDGQSIDGVILRDYVGGFAVENPGAGTGNLRFISAAVVPEPGTLALLLAPVIICGSIAGLRRRE